MESIKSPVTYNLWVWASVRATNRGTAFLLYFASKNPPNGPMDRGTSSLTGACLMSYIYGYAQLKVLIALVRCGLRVFVPPLNKGSNVVKFGIRSESTIDKSVRDSLRK